MATISLSDGVPLLGKNGKEARGGYRARVPSRIAFDGLSTLEVDHTPNPDVAIVEMTAKGNVKDADEPDELSYVGVLIVREGKIVRYRDYWNPLTAFGTSDEGGRTP